MTYPIQLNVPICPKCSEALSHNHITHDYFCRNCKTFFIVVDQGVTDRELLCKENTHEPKRNVNLSGES